MLGGFDTGFKAFRHTRARDRQHRSGVGVRIVGATDAAPIPVLTLELLAPRYLLQLEAIGPAVRQLVLDVTILVRLPSLGYGVGFELLFGHMCCSVCVGALSRAGHKRNRPAPAYKGKF